MRANRSIPNCTVIPELAYPDVVAAAEWLCEAFGFAIRLQIANHRVQLNVGDGAVVVTEAGSARVADRVHSVMVRVDDVDAHHARAAARGATVVRAPADH